jgi:surfeit locus 1 family protein
MADVAGRSRFRILLWPTATTIPALILLLGLGFWQVQRLHWKEGLLAHIESQMEAPAADLPATIEDPASWEYRRVRVTGQYENGKELYLYAINLDGDAGYLVFTPLQRTAGDPVLVNRGWVPEDRKDPATRAEGLIAGEVAIEGIGRISGGAGPFTPANEPARNRWFSRDLSAMAPAVGMSLAPVMVDRDKTPVPGGWPLGGQTRIDIPNNHLQYAVTWFGLAYAVLVIFVIYARRALKAAKSAPST